MKLKELANVYECEKCGYWMIVLPEEQPEDICPMCGWNDETLQYEQYDGPTFKDLIRPIHEETK